jgi:hypothetical protein
MQVSEVTTTVAVIRLSPGEVLALRNLTEHAGTVPFEFRGPAAIFEELSLTFSRLAEQMSAVDGTH